MLKLILLFSTLVMATVYKYSSSVQSVIHPFPLRRDIGVMPTAYLFYLSVLVNFSVLSFLLYQGETTYRRELLIFFALAIGNLLDFLLRNGMPFAHIGGISITYTMLSAICFAFVILYERV